MHNRFSSFAAGIALAAWLIFACGGAGAMEVWMPQTGKVDLESPAREGVDDQLRHAYALIGSGQWADGIAWVRKLMEQNPEAEWTEEARIIIARGLLSSGKKKEGFAALEQIRADYPESPLAERAKEMQYGAARESAGDDLELALWMYDELADGADAQEEAARIQKGRADAMFAAGRYLEAQDEYLALIDYYPDSKWVSYCWFKVADCDWQQTTWLNLGLEGLRESERNFADLYKDFADSGPRSPLAERAAENIRKARLLLAEKNAEIARFYIESEKRPWAAVNYLERLFREFPDAPQAEWAGKELKRIRRDLRAPLRGETRRMPLPGVESQASSEQP